MLTIAASTIGLIRHTLDQFGKLGGDGDQAGEFGRGKKGAYAT